MFKSRFLSVVVCGLLLVGCSRNVPVIPEAFDMGNRGCNAFNSDLKKVKGLYHFPEYAESLVFTCTSRKDGKSEVVLQIYIKGS